MGYSFPATDTFMRYFLAASLFENSQVRQIAICDPSESVALRAATFFDSPQHKDVFQVFSDKWKHVSFSSLCGEVSTPDTPDGYNSDRAREIDLMRLLKQWLARELKGS